ncbi:hypothetical protein AB0J83_32505 [Actinoplanes sp. NPDC049596]|uniref:hypothetical protein n=1 Tax=unclassified Actinoplanes TaxID=2626549 RepID=UPI00343C3E42
MPQGPRRLSSHRLTLALALVAAGPPLIIHEGWPGVPVAVAAAAYAAYLVLGKRWPRLPRRKRK